MQSNIQQITQQLVDRLPENDQYYRLDELRSWEFPSFIVRRIKIELERNLEESMIIPKTDWANTQSDAVLDAWQQFVTAIREEARLPASYGKTVIETAVADVVEMLVQPRKNIPKVIFRTDNTLSYDQLRERMQAVVVYPHFPKLVLRYMQKKERDELSKDHCKKIISNADKKLTKDYSPLNWAQMLEPLFKLVDGDIDTNLLRLFFEDKQMPRIARKFDLMDDMLTRAELIEVLSSPDLLNFEGYEDDQSSLFNDQPSESSVKDSSGLKVPNRESETKEQETAQQGAVEKEPEPKSTEDTEDPGELGDEDKSDEDEKMFNADFSSDEEQSAESDDSEDAEEASLNAIFRDEDEEAEPEKTVEQSVDSEDDKDDEVEEEDPQEELANDGDDHLEERVSEEKELTEPDTQANGQEQETESDEETPIWMRYMSDEEIEEYNKQQQQEEQDEEVEEGFIDDPIIDLTNEEASDEDIEMLRKQLSDDRDLFVEEIFGGSERAFDQAVEEIAAYSNWSDASKYIEKDIFKRNLVDMYSEAAVDFTDRLQSYFLEKQNQNK
jgi:hypothetical protein